ncbi:MAG: GyrI-like domain-containing protein [Methylovirgula sp.]
MNLAKWTPASFGLAILLALAFYAAPAEAQARAPATPAAPAPAAATTPAPAAPAAAATATPAPANAAAAPNAAVPSGSRPEQGSSGVPGAPSDATTETIVVPSRTTAMLAGKAKWDDGFASIKDALAKIKGALDKAGLKPAGSPFTVFTQTDDNGFSYEAMVPLAAKPAGELSDGVQLGSSPSGKAIKFHHRGPYDDIDSTYDRITTYLDEKDLEARDFFIEEYLTDLTSSEDPNLAVDIYVFIK